MVKVIPLVITINHKFGSGGAYLGQRIAERLNMLYIDHQIIDMTARKLNISSEEVTAGDEKPTSFWHSLLQYLAYIDTNTYAALDSKPMTNHQIFNAEAEAILELYKGKSAVILGRGSSYILADHPRHVSIFLYADSAYRASRIQEINNISEQESLKLVKSTDKMRDIYIREMTGHELEDACQYHLSLDTGILGLDETEKIILEYIHLRFGEM
ncbi:AAA family ATPase [Clostridium estertheticum]|uniref:cytidylate kinase-like family protein n=1 Tax=Clostridium estertheticum TaxID=238834 RepID=UPI001C7D098F|nr:cytidylate kinase-like family protein [Clostridium estertheticum]MBX4268069.1 cytidylate kinase-like family protein [Clostridium estertheticum]WLC79996.1 cytidylate kinase-like family protein [Clostridium estertheticum]